MMFRLDGKTALVSGGSKGIGRGIAEVFLAAGANVFVCDLRLPTDADSRMIPSDSPGTIRFLEGDITNSDQVHNFIQTVIQETGRIDIVCNNASYTTGAQNNILNATLEEWNNNYQVGLLGTWHLSASAIPFMKEQGGGSIIVISSIQAIAGCPASTAYSTIKAAQIGYVKTVAADFGPDNIRVNAICPGPIRVDYSPKPGTDGHEWQKAQTMLHRTGIPLDIGYAALYLASEEGSFVTGAMLPVDGGWTAK